MTRAWPRPARVTLEGRWTRLEPLAPTHAADLARIAFAPDAAESFRFLFEEPPADLDALAAWVAHAAAREDALFSAVIDRHTGRCGGRQALMRIEPAHGVIEVGGILWGPEVAGTRVAVEALHLTARHVFEDLGFRRLEWKCDARHARSRRAAERYGFTFEGVFRQHMWLKGANRDTAWYAMLDAEWPTRRAEFERWLAPDNFDAAGRQRTPLAHAR